MSFTPEQISLLRAPLSREHVKTREGGGRRKLSYIEGWHAIAEANRIFGFDAWDRETVEMRVVVERAAKIGEAGRDGWRVGYIAKVQIRVLTGSMDADGTRLVHREGTGYGSGIDADLGAAHESAIKEAETDAMKRALMTFGNPFGLALYDKEQSEVAELRKESVPDRTVQAGSARRSFEAAPISTPDYIAPTSDAARALYKRIAAAIVDAAEISEVEQTVDIYAGDIERLPEAGRKGIQELVRKRHNELKAT